MADVSHELGALRFVVDSPLSSKVAMFNNQATQHKQSQLLNPFSHDGRASSPKPTFSKDQYGKPLAGSLTEMRGQKANMHVMKEMLELCQIIDSEGYQVKDEPTMRVIPFGELFNIYNYISDKVVGILLRARKHKLLDFEGEMLYQRRDDDVPIFLLRPIVDIRRELTAKIDEIKRGTSPAPQSTSVMLDKAAHEHNLKVMQEQKSKSKSRTPSPAVQAKAKSPAPAPVAAAAPVAPVATVAAPVEAAAPAAVASAESSAVETSAVAAAPEAKAPEAEAPEAKAPEAAAPPAVVVETPAAAPEATTAATSEPAAATNVEQTENVTPPSDDKTQSAPAPLEATEVAAVSPPVTDELPTIVIEASAEFVRKVSVDQEPAPQVAEQEPETTPGTTAETAESA